MDLNAVLAGLMLEPLLEAAAGDQPIDELARALGVERCRGVPGDELQPIRDAGRFWYGLAGRSRDPFVGLRAAERTGARGLGLIECLARASATFGDAVDSGIRYVSLLGDRATVELVRERDVAVLRVGTTLGVPLPPLAADFALTTIVLAIRRLLEGDLVGEVCFVHAAPAAGADEYRRVLRCPVRFTATADEVRSLPRCWRDRCRARTTSRARTSLAMPPTCSRRSCRTPTSRTGWVGHTSWRSSEVTIRSVRSAARWR